jgi:hypothetical protein
VPQDVEKAGPSPIAIREACAKRCKWSRPQRAALIRSASDLVTLVGLKEPPARFAAGTDAVQTFEAKANTLLAQAHAHPELSAFLLL